MTREVDGVRRISALRESNKSREVLFLPDILLSPETKSRPPPIHQTLAMYPALVETITVP